MVRWIALLALGSASCSFALDAPTAAATRRVACEEHPGSVPADLLGLALATSALVAGVVLVDRDCGSDGTCSEDGLHAVKVGVVPIAATVAAFYGLAVAHGLHVARACRANHRRFPSG